MLGATLKNLKLNFMLWHISIVFSLSRRKNWCWELLYKDFKNWKNKSYCWTRSTVALLSEKSLFYKTWHIWIWFILVVKQLERGRSDRIIDSRRLILLADYSYIHYDIAEKVTISAFSHINMHFCKLGCYNIWYRNNRLKYLNELPHCS